MEPLPLISTQIEELDKETPSPYIFILYVDYLTQYKVMESYTNLYKCSTNLRSFFFADDIILYAKADKSTVSNIHNILTNFSRISGQKINGNKFKLLFSPTIKPNLKHYIVTTLGVQNTTNFGKYLGFALTNKLSYTSSYNIISENIYIIDCIDGKKSFIT